MKVLLFLIQISILYAAQPQSLQARVNSGELTVEEAVALSIAAMAPAPAPESKSDSPAPAPIPKFDNNFIRDQVLTQYFAGLTVEKAKKLEARLRDTVGAGFIDERLKMEQMTKDQALNILAATANAKTAEDIPFDKIMKMIFGLPTAAKTRPAPGLRGQHEAKDADTKRILILGMCAGEYQRTHRPDKPLRESFNIPADQHIDIYFIDDGTASGGDGPGNVRDEAWYKARVSGSSKPDTVDNNTTLFDYIGKFNNLPFSNNFFDFILNDWSTSKFFPVGFGVDLQKLLRQGGEIHMQGILMPAWGPGAKCMYSNQKKLQRPNQYLRVSQMRDPDKPIYCIVTNDTTVWDLKKGIVELKTEKGEVVGEETYYSIVDTRNNRRLPNDAVVKHLIGKGSFMLIHYHDPSLAGGISIEDFATGMTLNPQQTSSTMYPLASSRLKEAKHAVNNYVQFT